MTIQEEKYKLRQAMRQKLTAQPSDLCVQKSGIIENRLLQEDVYQNAKVILFYISLAEEVDTRPIIQKALQAQKVVLLPLVDQTQGEIVPCRIENLETDLKIGAYGILEPKSQESQMDLASIDLVVVPGLAFDCENYRLGRGKGCYDRFLKKLEPRTKTYGLCFDFQKIDRIPSEAWD